MIIEGTSTSYVDAPTAAALRQRLVAVSQPPPTSDKLISPAAPHVLVDHPNESISAMAKDYTELQGELTSSGPYPVTYPNNQTLKNFAVYQLIPTLVYELEYPRTESIRPLYVFEKTVATFGTFALLYTMTETFILPLTPTAGESFFRALLDLALPFMMAYLLLFYIMFGKCCPTLPLCADFFAECICNGFAELS
jgi:sterol O-acyltransferase